MFGDRSVVCSDRLRRCCVSNYRQVCLLCVAAACLVIGIMITVEGMQENLSSDPYSHRSVFGGNAGQIWVLGPFLMMLGIVGAIAALILRKRAYDKGVPIMLDETGAIVCDVGSGIVKAGFAGEDVPRRVLASGVGRVRHPGIVLFHERDYFVGEAEIQPSIRGLLNVRSPVEYGVITHWADMDRLWEHVFVRELQVDPEEYSVLLTETPLNPRPNREKTLEAMFETFHVRGAFLAMQQVLALYASGRTSGLVLDCGHAVTHWVPVVEGYVLPQAIARIGFGGRDLVDVLVKLLARKGYTFPADQGEGLVRDVVEKVCYVSQDPDGESRQNSGQCETYSLPDGSSVRLEQERFQCPEALFQPELMGLSSVGIDEAARLSLERCPNRVLRRQLCQNVILSGGTTLLRGFKQRVEKGLQEWGAAAGQLQDTLDPASAIKVLAPPNRKYAAWTGGAIVASMSTFQPLWIQRWEYEEQGPKILLRKCF